SPTKQSPTRRMIKGKPTGYTSPATYAHLSTVSDHLAYGMRVLFVGINPGIASSANQHHYANPANAFWPCLSASGLVTENVTCIDDHRLPRDYRLGLTNLVARPSRSSSEIRAAEFRAGRPILNAKIRKWRPLFVCFIGKGIFE
ncbi:uracil-DNA glycosylase-like protein, partial [Syncephalis plumigaleata]